MATTSHFNSNTVKNSTRSSSQTSIYDYPEHLNPFYEDENHKRLRFWNIGKKSQTLGRRSSFSLSGIKDMWAFKSFTLKKKSSTLGINKTSESPPTLRRELYDPNYNTIGSGYRSTVGANVGLNNNFLRNSSGRASYQDINRNKVDGDIGFNRNDRYRSTVQNGTTNRSSPDTENRYVYRGSVTPTPKSRYTVNRGMTPGSSQLSVGSTNPFDDDEDNAAVQTATVSSTTASVGKQPVRPYKKKRRAPPPPTIVPRPQTTPLETHNIELRIEEEPTAAKIDEEAEIRSLTAQIETFVHRSSLEEVGELTTVEPKPTPIRILVREPTQEKITVVTSQVPDPQPEAGCSAQIQAPARRKSKSQQGAPRARPDSPISSQVEEILEQAVKIVESQEELKIVESSDSEQEITLRSSNNNNVEIDNVNLNSNEDINKNYQKILTEAKSISQSQTREASIERNDAQCTEVVQHPPTGRRRSVRDIIESINRSQSLLKTTHQEPEYKFNNNGHNQSDAYFRVGATCQKFQNEVTPKTANTTAAATFNSTDQLQAMIEELEKSNARDLTEEYNRNSYYDNLPELMEKFDELNNKNSILFEKCSARSSLRKTAVEGAGSSEDKSGFGVNPVPKPRRSLNFNEGNSNNGSPPSSPMKRL